LTNDDGTPTKEDGLIKEWKKMLATRGASSAGEPTTPEFVEIRKEQCEALMAWNAAQYEQLANKPKEPAKKICTKRHDLPR
jgi:hypothetical protein